MSLRASRTFSLGVTGGIGAGKTTVCRLLEGLGARVFYADAEAKRLMAEDPALRADLVAAFGPETFRPDGRLDRAGLGARVFGDPAALARLNALVHPHVMAAWDRFKAEAEAAGASLAVHEAALLLEAGGAATVDAVLLVEAPLAVRVARAAARDAVPAQAIEARAARQMPVEEARRHADYVLVNDGDEAALARRVEALVQSLPSRTTAFDP